MVVAKEYRAKEKWCFAKISFAVVVVVAKKEGVESVVVAVAKV